MKLEDISENVALAICIVAILFSIYAIYHDNYQADDMETRQYRQFAREIYARLHSIPELDEVERSKIEDNVNELIRKKEERKVPKLIQSWIVSATRGCLTGAIAGGGLEAAAVGGVVFGAMTPVIMGIEHLIGGK